MNKNKTQNDKTELINQNDNVTTIVEKKIDFFRDVIQKTIIHVQKNKILDILGISDVSICIERLYELNNNIKQLKELLENVKY